MHKVVAEQISSLWLNGRIGQRLLEQLKEEVETTQQDNARARRSHQKRTRRLLRARGIKLSQVKRCYWPRN